MWGCKQYSKTTKIKAFNTLVKPVLLYGSETWRTNVKYYEQLDSFQHQYLERILGIFWPYVTTTDELNQESGSVRMSLEVRIKRCKFLGHALRMPRQHHCTTALTWTPDGKTTVGRPKTTWRCSIEKERNETGWKSWDEAREVTRDRVPWNNSVKALCATEGDKS